MQNFSEKFDDDDDDDDTTQKDNGWTLDRRIPIALLLTFLFQIGGALIWATELDARVDHLEHDAIGSSVFSERFGRVEERLEHMKDDLGAVKQELDKLTDRLLK